MVVKIEIELIDKDAKLPVKKYNCKHGYYDLGWDVFCLDDVMIPAHSVQSVRTGFKMRVPKEYGVVIKDRSSRSFHHHIVGGVYDASFRGEVCINVLNFKNEDIMIYKGERFAQMVIIPNMYSEIDVVCGINSCETDRGSGCLGSTDKTYRRIN